MWTQREKVLLALGGSVLLHLGILLVWALLVQWIPGAQAISTPPAAPDPLKVEIVEEEKPPLLPAEPTPEPSMKPFVDTSDLTDATPPPGSAKFESGKNTVAASEEPATGDQPLPSQHGKKLPAFAFSTQSFLPGETKGAAEDAATPSPETAPPPPKPTGPKSTPLPAATPVPTPAATPEQIAAGEQLAMLTPASIPAAPSETPNPYDPSFRPPSDLTEPPMPTPDRAAHRSGGGFRSQEEKTSMTGNISRRGLSSVDSEATPSGRYKVIVIEKIKTLWGNYVMQRSDVVSDGVVKIRVIVDRYGHVMPPRVISNTANEALASVSLSAVTSAHLPPMPDEAASLFEGGRLQMDVEFSWNE